MLSSYEVGTFYLKPGRLRASYYVLAKEENKKTK